ncbi:hypothetical protein B0H17DRAFT_571532 [Mycena rosella]|uniref:Uncharacterized protein n=1 Tax=Mycena rosella TaxID=1033263 RepID=A0AAD7M9G2_MYCRO|nr:hypothetical protein B0H17DRAFT_571532 [Mycena rosella]
MYLVPAHRQYKKASQGSRGVLVIVGLFLIVTKASSSSSHMRADQTSLRKQVLLRCLYRGQQPNQRSYDSNGENSPRSEDKSQCDLDHRTLLSIQNKLATQSRAPRRTRTHLLAPQQLIQRRIDEIKRCMRSVHLNAWLLRQAAALRRCPDSHRADPKAYFTHKRQYLVRYRNRYVPAWETELETLLGALKAPPWDKIHWRNNLSLVLDSVQVVIEAM